MKRLCIWVWVLLSGLLTLQAQESGPHSPRILGLDCSTGNNNSDIYLDRLDVRGCTALTDLDCSDGMNRRLYSLDVSGCTSLTSLDCSGQSLSRLDVSKNTALASLDCCSNNLSSIDVSGCTALTSLNCMYNHLSSIDVSKNTALTSLNCRSNRLSSLDVSKNTALASLNCSENSLSSLDVSGLTFLTSLECFGNQLRILDVSGCTALKELRDVTAETLKIYGESMDMLTITTSGSIDSKIDVLNAAGCTTLRQITCSSIGRLNLQGCTALMSLKCYSGGKVSSINVRGCTSLKTLSCYNSSLSTLDVSGCTALTSLDCYNDQLSSLDVSSCTALKTLNCYDNQLSSLNVSGCTALEDLDCSNTTRIDGLGFFRGLAGANSLQVLDVSACTALESLDCTYNDLTSLNVSKNTALERLYCSGNNLTSLDVSKNTALINLNCGNNYYFDTVVGSNHLSSLDVSGCTALASLGCAYNDLTGLDVSGCTALTSLSCHNNQLSSLDVSGCTALTSLSCHNNQLSSLDVSGCTALTSLDCRANQLSSLDVSKNTALKTLNCYDNQLSSLDVSGCTALTSLSCHNNQLSSLDVSGYTALTSLTCHNNQLRSLDVSGCTALSNLSCGNNRIPLSMLYKARCQRSKWESFKAGPQSDSIIVLLDESWDLSMERILGQRSSEFSLTDTYGGTISSDSYTENKFVFQFHEPGNYQLKLTNRNIFGGATFTFTFTWHVSVMPCYAVQLAANNPEWGTVTGNGIYERGTEITITATANNGCLFNGWKKDGKLFSDKAVHTFTVTENLDLTADFEAGCTVQVASNNPEWGTVTGSGIYKKGTEITISARPKEGYRFVNWTKKDGTEWRYWGESISFSVMEDLELTANFEEVPRYTVRVVSSNPEWGTATIRGWDATTITCEDIEIVIIEATPNEGYRFVNWTREDGTELSTESVFELCVRRNWELTANFEKLSPTETFTVSLSSNNPNWGIVSLIGNGTCERGEVITIIATPMTGFRFVNWTKQDGSVFTTEAVHAFAVIKDLELTANFEKIPEEVESFTIFLAANNNLYGSVSQSGNGTYEEGSRVIITATPNDGYRFVNWTRKNGSVFSTEAVHTFTVTENLELTANFEKIPEEVESFTVVLSSNNNAYGSVSQTGSGTYGEGSQVTITATPNNGYRFVNWTRKNGAVFTTESVHTFTVTEDLELTANFEKIPEEVESFTVVLSANNHAYGSVSQTGSGTYEEGSQVTITATPNDGYLFVNWTGKNGAVFATEAVHTFTVTENMELTANFEKIPEEVESFTVVLASNNNAYGRVSQSGSGTYEEGSQVTITATPNNGYRFVNWTRKNGSVFTTEAVHTFTVTENMELTANFEKKPDVANENREEDGFYVYVQDHTIHLSVGRGVARVYNAAGVCVYSGESTAIPVQNSGLYIVRVGERAYKAMVR